MNSINLALARATDKNLERVIEPLASYISAASRPKAVLASALAVLLHEVEETISAANAHVTTFLENH